jgi:hypothetical protein
MYDDDEEKSSLDAGTDDDGEAEAVFRRPLEREIQVWDLVRATVYGSPFLTEDIGRRALYVREYPGLLLAFQAKYPDTKFIIQDAAGLAVTLAGDQLDIYVLRRSLRFDWSDARRLSFEIEEMAEEVRRWVPDKNEQQSLLDRLFAIMTEVHTAIAQENLKHTDLQAVERPKDMGTDLAVIAPRVAAAKAAFLEDAQRAAQTRYARGMAIGGIWMLGLWGAIVGCLALDHLSIVYCIGLLAGGIGAAASVLRRMSAGTLTLNFKATKSMLTAYGGVRVFIGGVFGMVTFCILRAGLISELQLPPGRAKELAFVTVFAFVAGFNERFFQDALATIDKTDLSESSA